MTRTHLYVLANALGAAVLVLLYLDPTRPLLPIFALLAVAVACAVAPSFFRK